ncbi:MAG TPA: bluf domain protein [Cytophagales bacterium]|jgi:hypothetical protein|nr:bluf domain protein [Cytophagales bacterium]
MLSQLTYVSTRNTNCTEAEIEKILGACKKNNPPLAITGILLYSDNKFIQMVEGDSKVILGLYDKIKTDNRHSNCTMISYGPITEKSFPSWHMGARKLTSTEVDFKTDITKEDKDLFDSILNGKEANGSRVLGLLKKFF